MYWQRGLRNVSAKIVESIATLRNILVEQAGLERKVHGVGTPQTTSLVEEECFSSCPETASTVEAATHGFDVVIVLAAAVVVQILFWL